MATKPMPVVNPQAEFNLVREIVGDLGVEGHLASVVNDALGLRCQPRECCYRAVTFTVGEIADALKMAHYQATGLIPPREHYEIFLVVLDGIDQQGEPLAGIRERIQPTCDGMCGLPLPGGAPWLDVISTVRKRIIGTRDNKVATYDVPLVDGKPVLRQRHGPRGGTAEELILTPEIIQGFDVDMRRRLLRFVRLAFLQHVLNHLLRQAREQPDDERSQYVQRQVRTGRGGTVKLGVFDVSGLAIEGTYHEWAALYRALTTPSGNGTK